jgi:hypothetical protein
MGVAPAAPTPEPAPVTMAVLWASCSYGMVESTAFVNKSVAITLDPQNI